jgi:hypothetical protein
MRDAAVFFVAFYQVIEPFLSMAVVAMGWLIVAELRAHGYKATYASAIVRAMGAGVMAAQDRGLDPFSRQGRILVAKVGAEYIESTVPQAADALDLHMRDHAARVEAQLGVAAVQAVQEVVSTGLQEKT